MVRNRDKHYGFINYASAMAADAVFFNSRYHMESFYDEAVRLLKHFPDHNEAGSIDALRDKSSVLPLGMDLRRLDEYADFVGQSAGAAGALINEAGALTGEADNLRMFFGNMPPAIRIACSAICGL